MGVDNENPGPRPTGVSLRRMRTIRAGLGVMALVLAGSMSSYGRLVRVREGVERAVRL